MFYNLIAMKKDTVLQIRLSEDEKTEIERLAKIMGISAAELIRRAVLGLAKKVSIYQNTKKPANASRKGT